MGREGEKRREERSLVACRFVELALNSASPSVTSLRKILRQKMLLRLYTKKRKKLPRGIKIRIYAEEG